MKVWLVGVSNAETSSVSCVCSNKEIALREMFKVRDSLLKEWMESKIYHDESTKKFITEQNAKGIYYGFESGEENMYERMINNLSSDDYENWNNYPQDCPWICEKEVI